MKVLAVTDRYWPCDHVFLEEVLADKLPRRGYEVTFVMEAENGAHAGEHQWRSATVVVVAAKTGILSFVKCLTALGRLYRSWQPDVLFVRNRPLLGMLCTFLGNCPVVYQLSHFKEETVLLMERRYPGPIVQSALRVGLSHVSRVLRSFALGRADLVLPISWEMARVLRSTGERREGIEVVPLGAAPCVEGPRDTREATRRSLNVESGSPLLLYVGTLNRVRQLDVLLDALVYFVKEYPDSVLVFVGEGPSAYDRRSLEKRIEHLGLEERVRFLGSIPRQKVKSYIQAADVGLSHFPDHWIFKTNSPIKVMEYLSCGLPVVCSNQPEQAGLVRECEAGVVVDPASPENYAQATARVINRTWNRNQIRSRFLAQRSLDIITAKVQKALDRISWERSAGRLS